MATHKIRSLRSLREEMKAVTGGKRRAPPDAARMSFNSVEALARLLTPDNRRLLALIRDRRPQSVAELATPTGWAPSKLTRILAKLETAGLVTITSAVHHETGIPHPAPLKPKTRSQPTLAAQRQCSYMSHQRR